MHLRHLYPAASALDLASAAFGSGALAAVFFAAPIFEDRDTAPVARVTRVGIPYVYLEGSRGSRAARNERAKAARPAIAQRSREASDRLPPRTTMCHTYHGGHQGGELDVDCRDCTNQAYLQLVEHACGTSK